LLNVLRFDKCTLLNVLEVCISNFNTLSKGRILNSSMSSKVGILNLSMYVEY
jgi:hypothetical protein